MLRAAYLLAANNLAQLEYRRSELRMELTGLEKRITETKEIKESFINCACTSCLGHGYIRHQYAQDDIKTEKCDVCHGTGLPKEV